MYMRSAAVALIFLRNAISQDAFCAQSFAPARNDWTSYFRSQLSAVFPFLRTFAFLQARVKDVFFIYPKLSCADVESAF